MSRGEGAVDLERVVFPVDTEETDGGETPDAVINLEVIYFQIEDGEA